MIQNFYIEFDEIIHSRKVLINEYSTKYEEIKRETDKNVDNIYFGKEALYLGHFCPSIIIDKISNFKRGILKNTLRKGTKQYVSYEVDKSGNLLRIKDVNSYGTVFETYVIRNQNEEISITFLETNPTVSVDSTRAIYDKDKIIRCDFISNYSLWSEIYNYDNIDNKLIKCVKYYYVPELKGSDKSKKPGYLNSPARQFEIDIYLGDKNEIIKLEYGELKEGYREVQYLYELKNK